VDVLGQSGKMTLSNGDNQVTVAMDNLYELNAAGSIIGNTGPNAGKHSRQTFASVDFSVNDTARRTSEFGVPADAIDFRTTLLGSSDLVVSTFVFLHNGVIHPTMNESWAVAGGSVKFAVELNAWPFCSGESGNPCRGETGAFLELGIEIKGSADVTLAGGDGKRFTLATNAATGNNVTLELSDEVLLDGIWVRMPEGYPKIEMQGSKQLFMFRFPRFTSSCLYDPVINGLGTSSSGGSGSNDPQSYFIWYIVGASVLLAMAGLIFWTICCLRPQKQGGAALVRPDKPSMFTTSNQHSWKQASGI